MTGRLVDAARRPGQLRDPDAAQAGVSRYVCGRVDVLARGVVAPARRVGGRRVLQTARQPALLSPLLGELEADVEKGEGEDGAVDQGEGQGVRAQAATRSGWNI